MTAARRPGARGAEAPSRSTTLRPRSTFPTAPASIAETGRNRQRQSDRRPSGSPETSPLLRGSSSRHAAEVRELRITFSPLIIGESRSTYLEQEWPTLDLQSPLHRGSRSTITRSRRVHHADSPSVPSSSRKSRSTTRPCRSRPCSPTFSPLMVGEVAQRRRLGDNLIPNPFRAVQSPHHRGSPSPLEDLAPAEHLLRPWPSSVPSSSGSRLNRCEALIGL
jgi:hypothetical protein